VNPWFVFYWIWVCQIPMYNSISGICWGCQRSFWGKQFCGVVKRSRGEWRGQAKKLATLEIKHLFFGFQVEGGLSLCRLNLHREGEINKIFTEIRDLKRVFAVWLLERAIPYVDFRFFIRSRVKFLPNFKIFSL
jgi:hypothetical protein